MNKNVCGNVVWLSAPIFDQFPWVASGTSTRLGGVSSGCVESMNFCPNEFDTPENIAENRRIFFDAVGIDGRRVADSKQVHKTDIAVVREDDMHLAPDERTRKLGEIDGLVTNVPGATLACYSADCCIVTIVDPENKAVGVVHAGWRGTVAKIAEKTLALMRREYGTDAKDVFAALSPAICKKCFEVGEDVIEAAKVIFDKDAWSDVFTPNGKAGKYQFDIWEANTRVLEEAGVRRNRIEKPGICTCCNPDWLFSHRATGGKRGTIMTFVGIRN